MRGEEDTIPLVPSYSPKKSSSEEEGMWLLRRREAVNR